ncbi:helix-turn-helix transcriptional regulator [Microvirga thermotolerans]|uniref:AlpA family phage regulatory protein n=1 Tax=Microvirga thermotolerans TaxID=2651334 RepID=A0A5P9JVV6_9HYPH|nr:AlpA family phage regulatory protein [Microvirga thermotolerans]
MIEKLLLPKEVYQLVRLSEATVWRMRRKKKFPDPISISDGRVAYRESEVVAWIARQPRSFV